MSESEEFNLPSITPQELQAWLNSRPEIVLLDVREPYEFPRARLNDTRVAHAPLSDLARKHFDALPAPARDKEATLVVFCHHGTRSAQVTAWLLDQGWQSVYNLSGGIDAYARQIDPAIGFY